MGQNLLNRHYTAGFARFVMIWISLGMLALFGIIASLIAGARDSDDPLAALGAVSIVVFGLFLYSVPSIVACASVHPSRTGIYFVNWLLGWSVIGWLGAMIWALSGLNARMAVLNSAPAFSSNPRAASTSDGKDGFSEALSWIFGIAAGSLVLLFLYHHKHTLPPSTPAVEYSQAIEPHATVSEASGSSQIASGTAGSEPDVASMSPSSYEEDRAEFHRELKDLEQPAANLRWYPVAGISSLNHQGIEKLVTPYGPCALLTGDPAASFSVLAVDMNPYRPQVPSTPIGAFSSKSNAREAAVAHCSAWYQSLIRGTLDPVREQHIWFRPDTEATPPIRSPLTSASVNSREMESTIPPIEASAASSSWILQPNGDEILTGAAGPCATLALQSAHDPNKVHLTFADGSIRVFDVDHTAEAMKVATKQCR